MFLTLTADWIRVDLNVRNVQSTEGVSDDNIERTAELLTFILTHCLFTDFKYCILDAKESNLQFLIAYSLINLR